MSRKKLYRLPDKRSIDLEDEYQLDYWANQLGVSRQKLLLTIKKTGTMADDVKRNLTNKYVVGRN